MVVGFSLKQVSIPKDIAHFKSGHFFSLVIIFYANRGKNQTLNFFNINLIFVMLLLNDKRCKGRTLATPAYNIKIVLDGTI